MSSPWILDKRDKNERDKLRRVLGKLSREERLVCIWKRAGFSTREIANHHGRSVGSIDKLFSQARRKLRELLGEVQGKQSKASPSGEKTIRRSGRKRNHRKQIK